MPVCMLFVKSLILATANPSYQNKKIILKKTKKMVSIFLTNCEVLYHRQQYLTRKVRVPESNIMLNISILMKIKETKR